MDIEEESEVFEDDINEMFDNTEFIQSIKIFKQQDHEEYEKTEEILGMKNIDIEWFEKIFVELFYLMYSCMRSEILPVFHSQLFGKPVDSVKKFKKKKNGEMEDERQKYYYVELKNIIKKVYELFLQLKGSDSERIKKLIKKMEKIEEKNKSEQECFFELQNTSLMYQKSIIYNIQAYSLTFLIFKSEERLQKLHDVMKREMRTFSELNLMKCKSIGNKIYYMEMEKSIQLLVHEYYSTFDTNPYYQKIDFRIDLKKDKGSSIKFSFKIRPSLPMDNISVLQFQVTYYSSENKVNIRLVNTIPFSLTDQIYFQWNSLLSNKNVINIEVVERGDNRFLILKGKCQLDYYESHVLRIIWILDNMMVSMKCLEIMLKIKKGIEEQDYSYFHELYKKTNHYMKMINYLSQNLLKKSDSNS